MALIAAMGTRIYSQPRIETETETETRPVSVSKPSKVMDTLIDLLKKHPHLLELSGAAASEWLKSNENFEVTPQYINKAKKELRP